MVISFKEIEKDVDKYLSDKIDKSIPRYKYIYHCQCAYSDYVLQTGILFTSVEFLEKQYLFSLNYNIHLAYKYLNEDENFKFEIDDDLYKYAKLMLHEGYIYAKLCDIFPKLYSGDVFLDKEGNNIHFKYKNIPRRNNYLIEHHLLRRPFSYALQLACGWTKNLESSFREIFLLEVCRNYWSENLFKKGFNSCVNREGIVIRNFFLLTALRRYILIYDNYEKLKDLRKSKLQILFSRNVMKKIKDLNLSKNHKNLEKEFEYCIYKPLGKGDYPKANIADSPFIKTNNGCVFGNPLIVLFNNSLDTQYLNYFRRNDNKRFLELKDYIKEDCIPQVKSMLNSKIRNIKDISNFNVKIPGKNNHKRELDYLAVDSNGIALYIEFKHFFIPESVGEMKNLDKELNIAIEKIPKQLDAIRNSWDSLKENINQPVEIKELYGIIVSHMYTGMNIPFNDLYPLVNMSIILNSINHSNTLKDVYKYCLNIEKNYKNIPTVLIEKEYKYAGYNFVIQDYSMDRDFERKINDSLIYEVEKKLKEGNIQDNVLYLSLDFSNILPEDI